MVRDLDNFFSYPWGRLAFERTIRMVKVGEKVTRVSQLTKKLRQKSLVVHGFPIAIQLFLFRSIPLLLRHLPFADDEQTFLDQQLRSLPMLKTYHTENILQLENDVSLRVDFILPLITEEVRQRVPVRSEMDPKIMNLLSLIESGYMFSKSDWSGGDALLPQMCICKKRKNLRCKCGASISGQSSALPIDDRSGVSGDQAEQIAKLVNEVARLRRCNGAEMRKFKEDVLTEMRMLVRSRDYVAPPCSRRPVFPDRTATDEVPQCRRQADLSAFADICLSDAVGDDNGLRPSTFVATNRSSADASSPVNGAVSGSANVNVTVKTAEQCLKEGQVDSELSVDPPSIDKEGQVDPELSVEPPSIEKEGQVDPELSVEPPSIDKEGQVDSELSADPPYVDKEGKVDSEVSVDAPSIDKEGEEDSQLSINPPSVDKTKLYIPLQHPEAESPRETIVPLLLDNIVLAPQLESHVSTHSGSVQKGRNADSCLNMDFVDPSHVSIEDVSREANCELSDHVEYRRSNRLKVLRTKVCYSAVRAVNMDKSVAPVKVAFVAFPVVRDRFVQKFIATLSGFRKKYYDMDGCEVSRNFFSEIYTPQQWVFSTHMDFMVRALWKKRGSYLSGKGIVILDSLLAQILVSQYVIFVQSAKPADYVWHPMLHSYVDGSFGDRSESTCWFKDVSTVYVHMNWGKKHWVGLVISLKSWHIEILDPLVRCTSDSKVSSYMAPLVKMLPHLIKATCDISDIGHDAASDFSYSRLQGLAQNTRTGDCGPFSIKFMELHSHGWCVEQMRYIDDAMVDQFRLQYSVNVYEEFVGKVMR